MKSQVTILIHRPLAEVFLFVANFENQSQWQAATIQNTQITSGPMGIGAQCHHVGKWLGRDYESVGEVIEYEPNRLWGYKSLSGPYDLIMHYHFERIGDNTHLRMEVEGDSKGFFGVFKFVEPLVMRLAQRMLRTDLVRLQHVLEGAPSRSTASPG